MKRLVCFIIICSFLLIPLPASAEELSINATAAALINGDNGEIIYSKNADARLPMASTTKIMTALLLCEYGKLDTEVTVTGEMIRVEGSSMGLLENDKVTLHDLLYGMLLASGNDAANVTAYIVGGSVENFVEMMNEKAIEIGLSNTHFVTPSGLDADDHYTTALELAKLARYAMENKDFADAASQKSATLNYGNPPYKRTLTNHNRLLKCFDGAVGIKTGFTKKSGRCLVSAAKRDGKYVIAVTLKDPDDWQDHALMLEYGLSKIIQSQYSPEKTEYLIPIVGGLKDNITINIPPFTVNSIGKMEIKSNVIIPEFLYAPIKSGDNIGKVLYYCNDEYIGEYDITSTEDIAAKTYKLKKENIFLNNILKIIIKIT